MSDDRDTLTAEEYARLAAMPLHSADDFHRFTGIGINRVRALVRDGQLPVFPSGKKGGDRIIVKLAMRQIHRCGLQEAKRRQAERSA